MTHTHTIPTSTLARVDNDRLIRGAEGLASGAYAITLTRQSDDDISAFIANGDGKTYSVTLTASRSFCGCNDAMYRGTTCKHSVALALFVIRQPATAPTHDAPHGEDLLPPINLKLAKVRRTP
jgi:uncharacterized Zn finger protein